MQDVTKDTLNLIVNKSTFTTGLTNNQELFGQIFYFNMNK